MWVHRCFEVKVVSEDYFDRVADFRAQHRAKQPFVNVAFRHRLQLAERSVCVLPVDCFQVFGANSARGGGERRSRPAVDRHEVAEVATLPRPVSIRVHVHVHGVAVRVAIHVAVGHRGRDVIAQRVCSIRLFCNGQLHVARAALVHARWNVVPLHLHSHSHSHSRSHSHSYSYSYNNHHYCLSVSEENTPKPNKQKQPRPNKRGAAVTGRILTK